MAAWSSTVRAVCQNALKSRAVLPKNVISNGQVRGMSGHGPRIFPLQPSRWQWHKTKDLLHFYGMVGLIPAGIIIFGVNVFVGPATLTPIPDDYVPKHWEYARNPITRFLARYVLCSPQETYEKLLHAIHEESTKQKIRALEKQIHNKMSERNDYKAYYYRPAIAKYHRHSREVAEQLRDLTGD